MQLSNGVSVVERTKSRQCGVSVQYGQKPNFIGCVSVYSQGEIKINMVRRRGWGKWGRGGCCGR